MADSRAPLRPVVALLTDFGTADHYVGAMKGAVLSVCRDATLVDIVHDVPPQDVLAGALELAAAFRYFPTGTVFLAVVDPGVGSDRRALAVCAGDYYFVAPDNGLLTAVLRTTAPSQIVELANPAYARAQVSRTFEGRDRFGPAAGWLASGVPLLSLGPPIADLVHLDLPAPVIAADHIRGVVLRVDRFGNLITNLDRGTVDAFAAGSATSVDVGGGRTIPRIVNTYAEADDDALCAVFGSSDHLEVAVRGASAARRLALGRGAEIVLRRS